MEINSYDNLKVKFTLEVIIVYLFFIQSEYNREVFSLSKH